MPYAYTGNTELTIKEMNTYIELHPVVVVYQTTPYIYQDVTMMVVFFIIYTDEMVHVSQFDGSVPTEQSSSNTGSGDFMKVDKVSGFGNFLKMVNVFDKSYTNEEFKQTPIYQAIASSSDAPDTPDFSDSLDD